MKKTINEAIDEILPNFSIFALVTFIASQLCTAAPNGTFIISAVFLTAQPDFKICLDYGNQTVYDSSSMCETNCQNYSYGFQDNWTEETIASKYELTCNNESFVNDTNSIGLFGLLCGALTFGMIADNFGRKKAMLFGCITASMSAVLTTVLSQRSIYFYLIGRFLMLATIHGASISSFVYAMEILPPKMRRIGMVMQLFYVFGFASLTILSIFTNNWVEMSWLISLYPLTILLIYPWIPESFRWAW